MLDANGVFTEDFKTQLPTILGDDYYNDPETKQQPTKIFDNVKDMKTLIVNYANAQRAISKKTEGMVKLPNDDASWKEFSEKIRPVSADKYELAIPEGDGKAGYEAIAKEVKSAAFEAGVPDRMLAPLWNKVTAALAAQNKALEDKGLEMMKADEEALKTELKENYDGFVRAGEAALSKLKNGEEVKKLLTGYGIAGHPAVRKLMAELAPLVLEGKTFGGEGGGQPSEAGWFSNYKYAEDGKPAS